MVKNIPPPKPKTVRVSVPVTAQVHEVYSRLAASTSTSLGKTMGEWLESTLEGAEFMAGKMEQAKKAPQRVMREIHAYALGVSDETGTIIERMKAKGKEERAALARDARVRSSATPYPPTSNTGGKVPKNTKNPG